MKVVSLLTNHCSDWKNPFYIEELEFPKVKVAEIKSKLLKRAKSLSQQPYKGQYEVYLAKLNQGHRRLRRRRF